MEIKKTFSENSLKVLLVGLTGLEPTAYRLTAECSTIELPWKMLGGDTQIRTGDEGVAVLYLSHLVMSPLNW